VCPFQPRRLLGGLGVVAERDLGKDFLRLCPRLLCGEGLGRADQYPPRSALGPVLCDPRSAGLAAVVGGAEPEAEAGEIVIPFDVIDLAGRSGQLADCSVVEPHLGNPILGKQWGSKRPLPPAFFLLLYVNGKYSEIGKKQVFARFPHFPCTG
jgi:hypothetical protein